MQSIEYTLATITDIPHIINMRKEFTRELVGGQSAETEQALDASQSAYFQREMNNNYFTYLAASNGEPIAMAGMTLRTQPGSPKNPSGRWAYIMLVYTKPEYRKRGISGNLVQKLVHLAKELDITALELHATSQGEPVYKYQGFELFDEPTYRLFL